MGDFLIYGANGYTGRLCAERAVELGLKPVLAGRNGEEVRGVAERLDLEWRRFALASPEATADGLSGVAAVLHAAGPFSATASPMVTACLKAGAHYVDVTGEISVFEALAALDAKAQAAGIALLPGAGFDVVPSDCLAAHVARRLSGATRLRLSIGGFGGFSRGTARTMIEAAGTGTQVRRDGRLVELKAAPTAEADFGSGPRPTIGVSWGDVATAWRSTGVRDIEVFLEASWLVRRGATLPGFIRRALGFPAVQSWLKRQVDRRLPEGPTPAERARGRSLFLAEAWDAAGRRATARLETAEAYTLTARTAVEIARRAAASEVRPGYQTPATAFGPDFILEFHGSERVDL